MQRRTGGGGGDPGRQFDLTSEIRRGGGQRASPIDSASRARTNPGRPAQGSGSAGQPGGAVGRTEGDEQAGRRGRLARPRRAPGPGGAGAMQAHHHAPGETGGNGEKTSGRCSGHGNPPRQPVPGNPPAGEASPTPAPHKVIIALFMLNWGSYAKKPRRLPRPGGGTTEDREASPPQEAPRAPPRPPQAPPMLMRALLPRRGRGGAIKSLGCAAPNRLCAHTQPPLFPCRRFALPLRYPVDWAGVQSEKKKNTKPNPNKRFISLETERRPRPWGTLWAGRSAGMGMGCATSPLGKPGKARRLAGRHALPSPTMQGQPGRARGAGYSGRSPGPEGWTGTPATPR